MTDTFTMIRNNLPGIGKLAFITASAAGFSFLVGGVGLLAGATAVGGAILVYRSIMASDKAKTARVLLDAYTTGYTGVGLLAGAFVGFNLAGIIPAAVLVVATLYMTAADALETIDAVGDEVRNEAKATENELHELRAYVGRQDARIAGVQSDLLKQVKAVADRVEALAASVAETTKAAASKSAKGKGKAGDDEAGA